MKINIREKPRVFTVGDNRNILIEDYGQIELKYNQQITFVTEDGKEYDVVRKDWGFYATPSFNSRLAKFNLLGVVAKNSHGLFYLFLVEKEKTESFLKYIRDENHQILFWLPNSKETQICYCGGWERIHVHKFNQPPEGEINLNIKNYNRVLSKCKSCNHFYSEHAYNLQDLYLNDYVDKTYGSRLKSTFERISSLPPDASDNFWRVKKIQEFFKNTNTIDNVLDVGSGLCVFLHALKKVTNWNCVALDPDPKQADHARNLGFEAFQNDFLTFTSPKKFDLITMNKVIEHIQDPLSFLKLASTLLTDEGYLYIEVPDGEEAIKESAYREEFFIDHFHAFSFASLLNIITLANFKCLEISRVQEPSGKYTLKAFSQKC